jgi:hypothetical protein
MGIDTIRYTGSDQDRKSLDKGKVLGAISSL